MTAPGNRPVAPGTERTVNRKLSLEARGPPQPGVGLGCCGAVPPEAWATVSSEIVCGPYTCPSQNSPNSKSFPSTTQPRSPGRAHLPNADAPVTNRVGGTAPRRCQSSEPEQRCLPGGGRSGGVSAVAEYEPANTCYFHADGSSPRGSIHRSSVS